VTVAVAENHLEFNMRVKFCSHSLTQIIKHEKVSVNPAWLYMQKWYELHGKNPNVKWLLPGIVLLDPMDVVIDKIVQEQPDILGLGLYVWNFDLQYHIAREVKKQLPNIIIICGGPQLSVHKETETDNQVDFFINHPYIDYVVYGDGEKPFQQIIDYHSGLLSNKDEFINIIENANGLRKIYPHETLTDELYLSQSPYVSQEAHMVEVRDHLAAHGIPFKYQYWAIEFARGCMYSCTFCDWSQNLTKKVKRRTHNWKHDIDLFYRLNVAIRETDANFGQWPDDIKAFDYAISLYDPSRSFSFIVNNTPKLKKDVTEYIITQNSLVYDVPPVINLQDADEDVLKAIDRPAVPWEAIVKMTNNLRNNLPPEKFRKTELQCIVGLPGQTVDSLINSYVKFFELGLLRATWANWSFLPNSPAADPGYQKFWGLDIKEVYFSFEDRVVPDLELLYSELSSGTNLSDKFYKVPMVVGHKTMKMLDLWTAQILEKKWNELIGRVNLVEKYNSSQVRNILGKLKIKAIKEATAQYNMHQPHIDKHGIVVWGHYHTESKLIYKGL